MLFALLSVETLCLVHLFFFNLNITYHIFHFYSFVSAVKLLEPLISAAAAASCQSPAGESDIPPQRVTPGPVVHSPVVTSHKTPVTDVICDHKSGKTTPTGYSEQEKTTDDKPAPNSVIPYDEIPIGRFVI